MHMPLDCPHGSIEGCGQPCHLRPAEPRLIVGVVTQGTVRRDRLSRHTGLDQLLDLRNSGKCRRHSLPFPAAGAL